MTKIKKNLVVVGDGVSGKSFLLLAFAKNEFREKCFIPTLCDCHSSDIEVNGKQVQLTLKDTYGQCDYERLRSLDYCDADVFLMCFSIDNPISLANIDQYWLPEVKQYCPNVPIILVGNKLDLRNDPSTIEDLSKMKMRPVTTEEGKAMAKKIEAIAYLECSAKSREGVQEIFVTAAKIVLKADDKKNGIQCNLL